MRRWLIWIPALMVASLIYWSVALGLGCLSLMTVSEISNGDEMFSVTISGSGSAPGAEPPWARPLSAAPTPTLDGRDPILVHLEESVEPEDVEDNSGSDGPGQTSF